MMKKGMSCQQWNIVMDQKFGICIQSSGITFLSHQLLKCQRVCCPSPTYLMVPIIGLPFYYSQSYQSLHSVGWYNMDPSGLSTYGDLNPRLKKNKDREQEEEERQQLKTFEMGWKVKE